MTAGGEVIVLGPGETGRPVDRTSGAAIKVGAAETGGAYMLRVAEAVPPGRWVPPHVHHLADEAWYVLAGVLTFRVGGRAIEAPPGAFVLVPRGTAHSFGNDGPGPAAYVQVFSPAGMEGYFEERALMQQEGPPGAGADFAGLDPAAHAALAKKYHMEFV